ncbi:MAG: FAD-binding oxidoreductase [Candidatus Peribacteraceae bacterium]|nr:FAD-binding oxidoreductase [Candidatus Peribacteraceae bacterium]
MAVPTFQVSCCGKRLLCPGVYELRFTKPDGFVFVPGQFVLFDVPAADDPADVQVRAYSVASAPAEPELLFVVKLVEGGRAARWVRDDVREGTVVAMRGPLGVFHVDRSTTKPYLFIATGTGAAPFRSQVRWLLEEEGERRPMDVLLGVRRPEDLFWEEEWRAWEREFPQLRVHASFLDRTPDWHGETGTLQDRACRLIAARPSGIYLCGSPFLVRELKESCLGAWGVPKEDVHVESYV